MGLSLSLSQRVPSPSSSACSLWFPCIVFLSFSANMENSFAPLTRGPLYFVATFLIVTAACVLFHPVKLLNIPSISFSLFHFIVDVDPFSLKNKVTAVAIQNHSFSPFHWPDRRCTFSSSRHFNTNILRLMFQVLILLSAFQTLCNAKSRDTRIGPA